MKKRLFVMAVLTGVILMVSFSVYAADNVLVYTNSGYGGFVDHNGQFTDRVFTIQVYFVNTSQDKYAYTSSDKVIVDTNIGTLGQNGTIESTTIENAVGCLPVIQSSSNLLSTSVPVYVYFPESLVLAPMQEVILSYEIHCRIYGNYTVNLTNSIRTQPSFTFKTIDELVYYQKNELTLLDKIKSVLEDLSEYFTNSDQSSSDLSTGSNTVDTQEAIIHQQELQWYQANEQAINAVGLDNFNFSSGTLSGFQVMQQQFGDIWTAIGDLNLIFVFTLTMSLATYITRHFTRTKATEHVTETTTLQENLVTGQKKAYQTTTVSRRIR